MSRKGKEVDVYRVRRKLMGEELLRYLKKLEESEGYDVELPPDVVACGGIGELDIAEDGDCELDNMASQALDVYNKKNGTLLALEKVEKANQGLSGGGLSYFITFHVVDQCDLAKPSQVFQAKVVHKMGDGRGLVRQVRPKPTGKTSKKGRRRVAA